MTEEINEIKDQKPKTENYLWLMGCAVVTAIAMVWRFYELSLKPLHHDEGVNGYFLITLFREGVYKYDPSNYHGPTLYYISLAFTKLFGLETFSIRASMAIFGVLMVVMMLFLRKYIGSIGSLAAGLFLALSPGMVYISRYFIHEIFFVFCSFGIVLGVLFFIEGRKPEIFAVSAMTLLLLVCFVPPVMHVGNLVSEEKTTLIWGLRIFVLAIEALLVFLVMRMLLSWDEGRPIYLMLASASMALFFATKETAFITIGTMLIACLCVWIWRKIFVGVFGEIKENELEPIQITWTQFREKLMAADNQEFLLVVSGISSIVIFLTWLVLQVLIHLLVAWATDNSVSAAWTKITFTYFDYGILVLGAGLLMLSIWIYKLRQPKQISQHFVILSILTTVVFLYVGALFFSSFFTYSGGVSGAFEAYAFWTKTGTGDHTQNGYLAYLKWGYKLELPIFLLSALGTLIAFLKGRHIFAMFAGLWALGLFLAYTIIPYKTPWLALSFILPMCIIAGYGINEIYKSREVVLKGFAILIAIAAVVTLNYQTYDLNLVRYDDDQMPYVYAHTTRGFLDLISEVERYAKKSGQGKEATIEIVSPDYWSMPWYMREYPHANFHGRIVPASTAEMIVAKKDEQEDEIAEKYANHYKKAGEYPLRPGVDLILLVRKDLAEPNAESLYYELEDASSVDVKP